MYISYNIFSSVCLFLTIYSLEYVYFLQYISRVYLFLTIYSLEYVYFLQYIL